MEAINWEAVQAISEALGVIVVIASLIFVGLQVRQNSEEIRSSNYHAVTDSFNSWNLAVAESTELATLWRKGLDSYNELNGEEKIQFGFLMRAAFRIWDTLYYQSRHGTGDTTLWEAERKNVEVLFSTPGCRSWWREHPYGFSADLAAYIENSVLVKYPDIGK